MLPGPGETSSLNSTQITPSASIFFTFLSGAECWILVLNTHSHQIRFPTSAGLLSKWILPFGKVFLTVTGTMVHLPCRCGGHPMRLPEMILLQNRGL